MDEIDMVLSDEADVLVNNVLDELLSYPDGVVMAEAKRKLLALLSQEALGSN